MSSLGNFLNFFLLFSNLGFSFGRLPLEINGSRLLENLLAQPQCVDKDRRCRTWAKDGGCISNWSFMAVNCRKICQLCDIQGQTALYNREKNLKKRLMSDYDVATRPIKNISDTIDVAISFSLLHLMNVDEAKQTVTVQGYLKMKWFDHRLTWEPSEHGEVERLALASSAIWHPSIILVNTGIADQAFLLRENPTPIMVNNQGVAVWTPRVEATSLCNFDVKYFPVDAHACTLTFGPWMQDGSMVNMTIWQIDDDGEIANPYILPNQKWSITSNLRAADDFNSPCCSEPWPVVHVDLVIQRHAPMMSAVVISPIVYVVITLLLCFLLPIRSVIRFLFASGDCLISIFLLQHLSGKIPEASSSSPVVVQITVALILESLLVMVWCGMLYHVSSPRCKVKLNQLALSFMKTLPFPTPRTQQKALRTSSNSYRRLQEPQFDLVDIFIGSDDGRVLFADQESAIPQPNESGHSQEADGGTPTNDNGTTIPLEANATADINSNLILAKLLNHIGLAVFTTIFFVEFIVVLVI